MFVTDDAFNKFSTVTKELSGSMNELVSIQ